MKTNQKKEQLRTYEGAITSHINPELKLRRSVMACLLFEKTFYEDGEDIANRIASIIPLVDPKKVSEIAIEARENMKLRHIPLFLVREMARLKTHKHLVASTLERIIQRPDELAEFVALYWKEGKQPLSAQIKKGLARAFKKFKEYALAKYNRPDAIKLRDVLFLCHAKPKDDVQAALWKRLITGELEPAQTWELILSDTTDKLSKKEKWEKAIDIWIKE
jgi:hypothetical protein